MSKPKEKYRIEELIKCCGEYPRYHSCEGRVWVQCPVCKNKGKAYQAANMSANVGWNKRRRIQLAVEIMDIDV